MLSYLVDGGNSKASDRLKVVSILLWFYSLLKELSPALSYLGSYTFCGPVGQPCRSWPCPLHWPLFLISLLTLLVLMPLSSLH